ncbi:PREDICTED: protein PDF-like isoform X2 [Vollenhovia emeryi]|uniref:protein PDF-like isoform X2 n=1 Tax=Vollenhovia emeryi TaxID=411798 RepID=UPI0005F3D04A|nr:PREDICTED: protein PDF-like isoform X2 [Vollenhovia emeryi]
MILRRTPVVRRVVIGLRSVCQEQISKIDAGYKRSSVFQFVSYSRGTLNSVLSHFDIHLFTFAYLVSRTRQHQSMANYAKLAVIIAVIIGVVCGEESSELEDDDRNILGLNLPYGRGLDSELQLARLMLVAPRFCHPKRNSELINSLLGLPKNMHNAGK